MRLLSGLIALSAACGAPPAPPERAASPAPVTTAPDPEIDRLLQSSAPPSTVVRRDEVVRIADAPARPRYHGKLIDLDVKNAEIVEVLRLLADVGRVNLIVADDVKGTVTLVLRQVPWDQALDVIARAKGLGVEHDGNVMTIGSVVYPPAH